MDSGRAAVQVLTSYWDGWRQAFPRLHRRAHWHIAHHLCSQGAGAPLGELLGLTRQALLLDDSTVRDRVADLIEAGDCTADPAESSLAARTIIVPTASLLASYDATLLALLAALDQAADDLQPGLALPAPLDLPAKSRALALEALGIITTGWGALLDQLFDTLALSSARRMEARRHLLSTSHRTLLLTAIAHHYGLLAQPASAPILADRLAASLLEHTGQNFQTTRDHLAYLLSLGLLSRGAGRALSVQLGETAVAPVHAAFVDIASSLGALLRRAGTPRAGTFAVRIIAPPTEARLVVLESFPVTIGRIDGNVLRLPAGDVSRNHCEITLHNHAPVITDLNSTNGTLINNKKITGPAELRDGMLIRIGPYELAFLAPEDSTESTIRHVRGRVPS